MPVILAVLAFPVFAILSQTRLCEKLGGFAAGVIGLFWIIGGMFWLKSLYPEVYFDDVSEISHIMENAGYGHIGIRHYFELADFLNEIWPFMCIVMMYNGYRYGGRNEREEEEKKRIIAVHERVKE